MWKSASWRLAKATFFRRIVVDAFTVISVSLPTWVAAASAAFASAKRKQITPDDLDGVPFVTLFLGDPVYQQLASAFSEYGARWNVVAETEFFSTACQLVAEARGVGIVDPVVSRPFTEGLVTRPFKPKIQYQIAILSPTHEALSQVAQDFMELLRSALRG
jgi:DNA-binding transcriptional LysR family regulator